MPNPPAELVTLIEGLSGMPDGLNVLPAPEEKVTAPAFVVRPDTPWIGPSRFCFDLERYALIGIVSANTPADGIEMLRSMMLKVIDALPSPWGWESVDGPVIDQSTAVPFLAARLRLTYSNGGPE